MTTIFQKVLEARDTLLHKKSAWKELLEHLTKFLDTDATPATVGIKTEGSGLTVPQAEIAAVQSGVMAEIAKIEKELASIEKREVADVKQTKKKEAKKTNGRGKDPRPKSK